MTPCPAARAWPAEISLDAEAEHVDFFANIGFATGPDRIDLNTPYSRASRVPEDRALPVGRTDQTVLALGSSRSAEPSGINDRPEVDDPAQ